ncbi:MAG: RluA family pseudouridine synthase [Gemmatimonadaceae bacterium]|nr:RluA family pseudouridine synthase [Gemmatimonadaceae bacterium]
MTLDAPPPGRHAFEAPGDGARLDLLVAARLGVSRSRAATLIAEGRVTVAGRREKASYRPDAGEAVVAEVPPPAGRVVTPEQIPLAVAYEDDDLLVVDKPAGMVVHPAPGNWSGTLVNALLGRGGTVSDDPETAPEETRAGLVHRLDKETSGLLLVAKAEGVHAALAAELAARRIVRRYAALAWGHLDGETVTVTASIGRDPRDRKRMAVVSEGRTARTDFVRIARLPHTDLLRAHLHTGRTHQIRVHLASVGHPVVGDDAYGGGGGRRLVALPAGRHFLHAAWLRFRHPRTGATIDLRSPLPADLARSLATAAELPDLLTHPDPLAYLGFFDGDG